MGRFGDLWKTGKFMLNSKDNPDKGLSDEVLSMMQESEPEFGLTEASHVVLSALKPRRGLETGRWLNTLNQQTENAQERLFPVSAPSTNSIEDMVHWVDELFKQFRDLAFEFNKTALNTGFLITVEPPEMHDQFAPNDSVAPAIRIYRGRLTSGQWALGIIGQIDKISVYMIPTSMLLAFAAGQLGDKDFAPFMEFVSANTDIAPSWTIGGQAAPLSTIPYLAKEMVGDLIRVASGVMSESELFASSSDNLQLGENLAVGYSKPKESQTTATAKINPPVVSEDVNISEACDIVDAVIEKELKALYNQASKLKPSSELATPIRTKISDLEKFRSQILAAFEAFTCASHK